MRLAAFSQNGTAGVGLFESGVLRGRLVTDSKFPGDLDDLIRAGSAGLSKAESLSSAPAISLDTVEFRPTFARSDKIICVGLNYKDHTAETDYKQPDYPTLFPRFTSSLVGHMSPIVRPRASCALDFEGELVAVIGRAGRHIAKSEALSYVAGYTIFNDGSLRDFQHRTPQWTAGKNFDCTGALGPVFVTADELPPGAHGLHLETRLNGDVVQNSNTNLLIFDVATLVVVISEVMTLSPGDLIVTGTPAGIGHSRTPKLYMKPGDTVEVEIEGIGTLTNGIVDEPAAALQVA